MNNMFYLFLLNRNDNSFNSINLNGKNSFDEDEFVNFVCTFQTEEELKRHLLLAGIINDLNCDVYVSSNMGVINDKIVFKKYDSILYMFDEENIRFRDALEKNVKRSENVLKNETNPMIKRKLRKAINRVNNK